MFYNLSDCLLPETSIIWRVLTAIRHVLKVQSSPHQHLIILHRVSFNSEAPWELVCQHTNLTHCMTTEHLCNNLILYVTAHVHPQLYVYSGPERACTLVVQED